ncbi:E3 ubiquitin-protein ligase CHIP-like isoform X2 [Watersipora subatra]|uniref:E3 ubiquitin-protein ligase CHIP-like isoform X2 n=1 Tax=Watersipora subatra TaxID=2589382 RepID=UPI00355B2A0F
MTGATELKEQGNRYFCDKNYPDAISSYSKAIIKNNSVATYYTNRALCYIKLKKWEEAIKDCKRALELDSNTVKGYYFIGESYLELSMFDESTKNLMKAFDLAKEQKLNFGDDISGALRRAKRKRFQAFEEKRIKQEIELQTYLNNLISADKAKKIEEAGASTEREQAEMDCDSKLAELNDMFKQLDERRQTRDVPDYLCGKISFELMRDPVITPSGITYDKKDIEEHLHRVGHFDPVTRAELTADKLIPNLAMKEVVDTYLQENPWAEEF